MSTSPDGAADAVNPPTMDMKVEVVVIPVADVDRSLVFYRGLGWRLDADYEAGPKFRIVQLTPPGSTCSVHFGRGLTPAVPGTTQGTYLVVADLEAARADLLGRGVEVSRVFHNTYDNGYQERVDGPAPDGRSYASFATFTDPDGNGWLMQEVKQRAPGR
ncbi:VOC family protein [Catellatospora paridis]|uniref:VOC family protein n=1 Tax=Catellatospora paridis TaxID=1617086 RepID=UPI001E2A2A38|nr:VOC family protein [Catellatospora paridis]